MLQAQIVVCQTKSLIVDVGEDWEVQGLVLFCLLEELELRVHFHLLLSDRFVPILENLVVLEDVW